jgi:hypothetical protein
MLQHQRAEVVDLVVNAVLLLALKRSSKIKPVIVRHEQAASFMALRLRDLFESSRPVLRNRRARRLQPVLRSPVLAVAMSDSYPAGAVGLTINRDILLVADEVIE